MKKFRCTVTRTDEYEIEIDENIINEEWMSEFREVFFDYYNLEEHAGHIANMRARFGRDFIEGYGYILQDGEIPFSCQLSELNKPNRAININIIDEDNDIDIEVNEL